MENPKVCIGAEGGNVDAIQGTPRSLLVSIFIILQSTVLNHAKEMQEQAIQREKTRIAMRSNGPQKQVHIVYNQ